MKLDLLNESGPQFKTLEDNKIELSDSERERVMKAKAVWHHGHDGNASPAIKKAVIRGRTYYYCNTHRCFQAAATLDGAIEKYFKTVKPSS